mgnify:CR=1 FL=1
MRETRKAVIDALQSATGFMNDAKVAANVMTGGNISFDVLGLDSLVVMEVVMSLEDELDVVLEIDVFNNVSSLAELVTVIDEYIDEVK